MQKCVAKRYTPIIAPDLVRESVLEKCGFQPRMTNTQTYSVADSDLCLTGTAEVPLGGVYMDKVVEEAQLPIRMAAYGHCFRTEAGAAGAAGKGLYRVHQFAKVEMFVVSTPEQSEALLDELLAIEVRAYVVVVVAVVCSIDQSRAQANDKHHDSGFSISSSRCTVRCIDCTDARAPSADMHETEQCVSRDTCAPVWSKRMTAEQSECCTSAP